MSHEDNDFFQHALLAEKIAQILILDDVPPNLAIYGPWGSGKSSLLELIRVKITQSSSSQAPIWFTFDAWAYQTDDALILAMLAHLAKETSLDFKKSLLKILKASAVSMVDILLKTTSLNMVSTEMAIKNLELFDDDKSFASKPLTIRDEFQRVVHELSKVNENPGERQVVLAVDNLDRCKPETAIRVLEICFFLPP